MDGLQESTVLYNNALLAANTTQNKFNIYLDSNESKLNKFKSRMEEMWLNTFNDKSLGKLIEFGTELVSFVDGLGLLNVALIASSVAFVVYADKINKTLLSIKILNPEIWIAVTAISALIVAVGLYNKHQKEVYENTIKNAKALSEESDNTKKLMESITDLSNKQSLSNDERERLGIVQAELEKMYPDILKNLDLEKASYEDLAEAVNRATQAKKQQVLEDIKLQKSKLQSEINSMKTSQERWMLKGYDNLNYNNQIAEKQQQLAELNALISDVLIGGSSSDDIEKGR
jgi:hypothetical protein